MSPLSDIHPHAPIQPGRYFLDTAGILFRGEVPWAQAVAAVVVLAPGEPTRRQLAELAEDLVRTDDIRATVDSPVDTSGDRSSVEKMRADCAAEASEREARFRDARRLTVAHPNQVTPRRPEEPLRSLARREKPRAVPGFENLIEQPDEDDEFIRQLQTRVVAKQAQRSKRAPTKAEPAIDGERIAAAYRAKASAPRRQPKVPTQHALSREACRLCGIPGSRGCDHFLPFEEASGEG